MSTSGTFYASRAAALAHVAYRLRLLQEVAGLLRRGAAEAPPAIVLGRMEAELAELFRVVRDLQAEEGADTPA